MFATIVVASFIIFVIVSLIVLLVGDETKTPILSRIQKLLGMFYASGDCRSSAVGNASFYHTDLATGEQIANFEEINKKLENITGMRANNVSSSTANAMFYKTTPAQGKILEEQERFIKNLDNYINYINMKK